MKITNETSRHIVILYQQYLGIQKNLNINSTLETTNKPKTNIADLKRKNKHEKNP